MDLAVNSTNRMLVLTHLVEMRGSTLEECASVIQHNDPFGAVLHMVAMGAIYMDLDRAVTPYSRITLAEPVCR